MLAQDAEPLVIGNFACFTSSVRKTKRDISYGKERLKKETEDWVESPGTALFTARHPQKKRTLIVCGRDFIIAGDPLSLQ